MSERNGPICCYRVYLVKLPPHKTVSDLPPPEEIAVYSYQYVHSSPTGGAYVVETFDSDQLLTEIFLGDGESSNGGAMCDKCVGLRPKPPPPLHFVPGIPSTTISTSSNTSSTVTSTTVTTSVPATTVNSSGSSTITSPSTTLTTTIIDTTKIDTTTAVPVIINATEKAKRRKREDMPLQKASIDGSREFNTLSPYDGFLDETSNYTGFVEIIGTYDCRWIYGILREFDSALHDD